MDESKILILKNKTGLIIAVYLEIARRTAILILCITAIDAITHIDFFKNILGTFCHQIPERCFSFAGSPIGICARCLGLYLGLILSKYLFPRFRNLFWLMTAIAIPEISMHFLGFDFANSVRFISGYCTSSAIYLGLSRITWRKSH